MAPMKKLPTSEAAAKVEGLAPMTAFFSAKAVPGRKKKKRGQSNAGRPKVQKEVPAPAAAAASEAPKQNPKKPKATRQNWAKGDGLKRMSDCGDTKDPLRDFTATPHY